MLELVVLPKEVTRAVRSLREAGTWAIIGGWLVVRIPLGGSDRVMAARIYHEEEVISSDYTRPVLSDVGDGGL